MREKIVLIGALMIFSLLASAALAGEIALVFNANDIFMYATEDGTRLEQQGEARRVWDSPTGRYYLTYNDSSRDSGATAAQDLQSVENILRWDGCSAGYQGVSHLQLWLLGDIGNTWGEQVVMNDFIGASVNDEFGWTADVSTGYVHFNTALGGDPAINQNAISPCYHPAEYLWSVTGDFYFDNNNNSAYDLGVDDDLVVGQQYTIWFNAANNNWRCVDAYGNDAWGSPDIEGTIIAIAVPEGLVDDINTCAINAINHGKFVSCVSYLTNGWKEGGLITGKEKGAIMSWAAKSNIP